MGHGSGPSMTSCTPVAWLVKGINKIMREEGERIGLRIKVMEESGTSHQIQPLRVPIP